MHSNTADRCDLGQTQATPTKASENKTTHGPADYRRRMLQWPNPVEFVNNMYGSHPGGDGGDYFDTVFGA